MGTPYISGESEASTLTERGYKGFFRTTPSSRTQARDFFTFLRDVNKTAAKPVKTIAVVHENTLWGQEFAKSVAGYFKEFSEFQPSAVIGYQQGTADVTSEVQRLIAAKPDAVFHASYDAEAILFARTYKQFNFNPGGVLAIGAAFGSSAFRDALGADASYFFVREHWSRDLAGRNPLVAQVGSMYKERYGKEMDGTPARAFTAMMVLADAINRAGSTDPDKIIVRAPADEDCADRYGHAVGGRPVRPDRPEHAHPRHLRADARGRSEDGVAHRPGGGKAGLAPTGMALTRLQSS